MNIDEGNLETSPVDIHHALHLVQGVDRCWKCHNNTPVYALATEWLQDSDWDHPVQGLFVLSYVRRTPNTDFAQLLHQHAPSYYEDSSRTAHASYLMNHCRCGAKLGDFFLHRAGGVFSPEDEYVSAQLVFRELLTLRDPLTLDCQFAAPDESMLHNAQRVA